MDMETLRGEVAELAEGAPLLREYTGKTGIASSNLALSASFHPGCGHMPATGFFLPRPSRLTLRILLPGEAPLAPHCGAPQHFPCRTRLRPVQLPPGRCRQLTPLRHTRIFQLPARLATIS